MDADMQFGQMQQAQPARRRRPDRNKHYAVVRYGTPGQDDLPVFVELDVLRDVELHARADTSVELGGVLLGGRYEDEQGRPFVVVTDSLRAERYEATKGSFKFTHATWERISRHRDQFPDDVQMVGWYHTHPDWGVFLSGMDRFICDHFFNGPLDLALVVDPCRGERAMFQWTGAARKELRRTGGFYLTASRFRRRELERFAAALEEKVIMASDPGLSGLMGQAGPSPAPVINITDGRGAWQGVAVMGMLTIQLLVLALLAWRLLLPPPAVQKRARQAAQLEAIQRRLDELVKADYAEAERAAQRRLLQDLVGQLRGGRGLVEAYEEQELRTRRAEAAADVRLAEREKLQEENARLQRQLSDLSDQLKSQQDRYAAKAKDLSGARNKLQHQRDQIAMLRKQLDRLTSKDKTAEGQAETARWPGWVWISLGAALVLGAAAGVAATLAASARPQEKPPEESPEDRQDETNNQ